MLSQSIDVLCVGFDPSGAGVGTRPELPGQTLTFTVATDRASVRQAFGNARRWDLVLVHAPAFYDLGLERCLVEAGTSLDASLILIRPPASTLSPGEALRRGAADVVLHGDREHLEMVMTRECAAAAARKALRALRGAPGGARADAAATPPDASAPAAPPASGAGAPTGADAAPLAAPAPAAVADNGPPAWQPATGAAPPLDDDRIKQLIEAGGLALEYQPIVPLHHDAALPGAMFEVLLRLRDEQGQLLSPGSFFPAAGRHHWLARLDMWVFRRGLTILGRIQESMPEPTRFFMNLFTETLETADAMAAIIADIEGAPISRGSLVVEVQGSVLAREMPGLFSLQEALARHGHGLLLDRVGLADGALIRTRAKMLTHVKLEPALLRGIGSGAIYRDDAQTLVRVALNHGIKVIALAVDSAEILPVLYAIGVEYIQGNFVSKPQPELIYPEVFDAAMTADAQSV